MSVRHDVILAQDAPPRIVEVDTAGRRCPAAAADGDEKNRRQPGKPGNPKRSSNSTMTDRTADVETNGRKKKRKRAILAVTETDEETRPIDYGNDVRNVSSEIQYSIVLTARRGVDGRRHPGGGLDMTSDGPRPDHGVSKGPARKESRAVRSFRAPVTRRSARVRQNRSNRASAAAEDRTKRKKKKKRSLQKQNEKFDGTTTTTTADGRARARYHTHCHGRPTTRY